MKLGELAIGAPFRYKGRCFYKGRLANSAYPYKPKYIKNYQPKYRVYEVLKRHLDLFNCYTLGYDTDVEPI